MRYEFELPIKGFSVNAYHYRDKRHKTKEAREWEEKVDDLLQEHKMLLDIADTWREGGGVFHVHFTYVYPAYMFYNNMGRVSSKTFDLTNVEKPLLDRIMNEFMDVDDKSVTKLVSIKEPGAMHCIRVRLELHTDIDRDLPRGFTPDTDEDGP